MSVTMSDAGVRERRLIWDLPLRVCHWLLVLALPGAYVTAQSAGVWAEWHGRIGGLVLALLTFRVTWGFLGSRHARFVAFVPTPTRLRAYFNGRWNGVGHNPLGALAVIAMLLALLIQVGTGLFANDDIAFAGPLQHWVSKPTSDLLSGWHARSFNVLLGLVALHLCAIVFHTVVKRSDLILPMMTGRKSVPSELRVPASNTRPLHVAIALLASIAVVWVVFRTQPAPQSVPTQPAAPAPAW
jgi:cytochrome b